MIFRVVWAFDALIGAVTVFFFAWGLADGRVSSFNIGIWMLVLLGLAVVLGGSLWLRSKGWPRRAMALVMVLAVPGFLYLVLLLVMMIGHPRWN